MVGAEGLYREAGYLVLSRGRAENWLLLSTPELDDLHAELARHDSPIPLPSEEPDDIDTELHQRLTTSRAKLLALTHDPHADAVRDAAASHDLATLEALTAHARAAERRASAIVGIDPTRTQERVERALHTARHAAVGHTVKALDRNNLGTITAVDDHAGTVHVRFTSATGQTAERTFAWADVQIVAPRHPEPRPLTATAQAMIDATIAPERDRIQRWRRLLADHDVAPDDRHVYETATRVLVDRVAARLAAVQPDWLTRLLGARPAAPAAAQVWDDTVRLVAAHRARHHIDDTDRALGATPAAPAAAQGWDDTHRSIAQARLWLDTHATRPQLPPTRTRSLPELQHRLAELDAIFATAPADHRPLIDQLRSGQLVLDDVGDLLTDALAAQGERRRWILEHWPHVVEHHQITHTLDDAAAGPEPDQLLQRLATHQSEPLASAAARGDRWLVQLASQLTIGTDDGPRPEVLTLLADIAAYRQRWDLLDDDLLGPAATSPEQAVERSLLTTAVDHAYATAHPTQAVNRDDGALLLPEIVER